MDRIRVSSSNIHSIGYENGVLEIAFLNGGIYQYLEVPEFVYRNLMQAPSHGKYFHAHIKDVYTPPRKISG